MKAATNCFEAGYSYPVQVVSIRHGAAHRCGYYSRSEALKAIRLLIANRHTGTVLAGEDCTMLLCTPFLSVMLHRARGMTDKEISRSLVA
jgi:hypothetical protein